MTPRLQFKFKPQDISIQTMTLYLEQNSYLDINTVHSCFRAPENTTPMWKQKGKREKNIPSFAQPSESKIAKKRTAADQRAVALQHENWCHLLGEKDGKKYLSKTTVGVEL